MTLSPGLRPCCISLTTVPGPTLEGSLWRLTVLPAEAVKDSALALVFLVAGTFQQWMDMGVGRLHFKALQQSHNDFHS